MLPIDIPTRDEFLRLAGARAPASVSIYIETTPVSREIEAARIAFANAVGTAMEQVAAVDLPRGHSEALAEHLDDLAEDDDFWARQARSLAVLATPDALHAYRLANRLSPTVQVSDRFHVKPLLRALTFPHAGFLLALSEGGARLVEFAADAPAAEIPVPGLPRDAASAVHKASINDRSHSRRITGSEGKKVRLRQYARLVDHALRPVLAGHHLPMVLASNPPLGPIYRSVASYPHLVAGGIEGEIDRMTDADLVDHARPVLDGLYADAVAEMRALFATRESQGRTTTDLSTAARAAVTGAVETLLVDMDAVVAGTLDEETGAIAFADHDGSDSYGIADQVAVKALAAGARVLSVRADDLPHPGPLAATLRYAF